MNQRKSFGSAAMWVKGVGLAVAGAAHAGGTDGWEGRRVVG